MAAAVDGVIYHFGGQTDPQTAYVDTVYALDTRQGADARRVERARMPTRRSAGAALVHEGRVYIAGGRPPRGHDFAVYDPRRDTWEILPDLPSQRNHIPAELIDGRIHVFGGRLGGGLQSDKTAAHEVYDPRTRTHQPARAIRPGAHGSSCRQTARQSGQARRGESVLWKAREPPTFPAQTATAARVCPPHQRPGIPTAYLDPLERRR